MENQTCQKEIFQIMESKELPLWQKYTLTVEEVSRYFRIGQAKLRRLINENEDAEDNCRNVLHHSVHQNHLKFTPLLHHFTEKMQKYEKINSTTIFPNLF